jgi:hypothetical protein
MTTKLTKDLVRETDIMVGETPLLVTLFADNTIGFKLRGSRKSYSKVHLTKVCAMSSGFESEAKEPEEQPNAPKGSVSIQDVFDKLEEEPGMPWPYKAALRKFLRRRYM